MLAAAGSLGIPAARAGQPEADILRGSEAESCESPDYVAGSGASGQPVTPADTGDGMVPALRGSVQPEISVRLRKSHGTTVLVNADNVLNPPPACPSH
ncbi:MAG TPA: hypothetical protein VGT78_00015 [Rhizomicrobium sp.]|nr:hypothetical protein [Rhizomicrobium sp.]